MPNRLLKEGIVDSSAIDALLAQEEVFFYRLLVVSDDFGRMDARLPILKSRCFPLKDIQTATIEGYLQSLVRQELIKRYQIDGKPYLQILKWEQRIRSKGKYPSSDGSQPIDEYQTIDSSLQSDDGLGKGLGKGKGKGKGLGIGKELNGAKAPKATRLPNDFVLTEEWITVCKQLRPELNPQSIFDEFKDFWIAKAGQDGCKLDWLATWRNWVRRQNAPKSKFTQETPTLKWHQTMAGVLAKGKEMGILPIAGETEGQYRERLVRAGA